MILASFPILVIRSAPATQCLTRTDAAPLSQALQKPQTRVLVGAAPARAIEKIPGLSEQVEEERQRVWMSENREGGALDETRVQGV